MARPDSAAASPLPSNRSSARQIVLHADDLGMNPAVTDGIFRGFEQGLLTSTSLLSNAPDAARALDNWQPLESRRGQGSLASIARRARLQDPALPFDLGIHLNLTQGRPLIGARYPAGLLDADGCFPGIFGLFNRLRRSGESVAAAIDEELACQVQFMLDRGHRPTHLNGHQYIEMLPLVGRVIESLLEKFRIPVVRVAWEPSWWQSFTWPGIGACQWLVGGIEKSLCRPFPPENARQTNLFPRRVPGHDDRRHDVAGDNSSVSDRQARLPACRNRHASGGNAACCCEVRRRLARPVGTICGRENWNCSSPLSWKTCWP